MQDFKWMGVYKLETQYNPGDVVYFNDDGFTYVCISPSLAIPPYVQNSGFQLMAGFDVTTIDGGEF